MMSNLNASPATREKILQGWSQERRHAWNAATAATKLNGSIVNQRSWISGFFFRAWIRFLWWFPIVAYRRTHQAFRDKLIYSVNSCPDGFFLESAGGGQKMAQIWVKSDGEKPRLSDEVILRDLSRLTILVIVRKPEDINAAPIEAALRAAELPEEVITISGVRHLCHTTSKHLLPKHDTAGELIYPCNNEELAIEGITPLAQGYKEKSLEDRLGPKTKYVIVRPDFFVHSKARNLDELSRNLGRVKEYFS